MGVDVDTFPVVKDLGKAMSSFLHRSHINDPVEFAREVENPPTVFLSEHLSPFFEGEVEFDSPDDVAISSVAVPTSLFLHIPTDYRAEERRTAAPTNERLTADRCTEA